VRPTNAGDPLKYKPSVVLNDEKAASDQERCADSTDLPGFAALVNPTVPLDPAGLSGFAVTLDLISLVQGVESL
jgi:hypothetical protein